MSDTSTAHQRAVLIKALTGVVYLPVKYSWLAFSSEDLYADSRKGMPGYLKMANGKFYLATAEYDSKPVEVYADGKGTHASSLRWRLDMANRLCPEIQVQRMKKLC